jgi:hypothetical protein
MADVDCGRVVDHDTVVAWAASLDGETPLPIPEARNSREGGDPGFPSCP